MGLEADLVVVVGFGGCGCSWVECSVMFSMGLEAELVVFDGPN